MPRKKLILLISVAFLLAGVALSIPGTNWRDTHSTLAFGSLVLGTLGSLASLLIPSNYTLHFGIDDWVDGKDEYKDLVIRASKHGQGSSPTVQVFFNRDGSYSEVITDVSHNGNGDVTVSIYGPPISGGKVIIS